MGMTIDNKELATDLIALAIMCANEGTDNCDILLTTTKGKINCHIEFSEVLEDGNDDWWSYKTARQIYYPLRQI